MGAFLAVVTNRCPDVSGLQLLEDGAHLRQDLAGVGTQGEPQQTGGRELRAGMRGE